LHIIKNAGSVFVIPGEVSYGDMRLICRLFHSDGTGAIGIGNLSPGTMMMLPA
jgi:hypothetical protein